MTLFVSHNTAIECWLSGRFDEALGGPSIRPDHRPVGIMQIEPVASLLACDRLNITYGEAVDFFAVDSQSHSVIGSPTVEEVVRARGGILGFTSSPLHLLVPSKYDVRHMNGVECHVRSSPLPGGSFFRIGDGVLSCSPELCLLQVATYLPFPLIVKLGMELCALYSRLPDGTIRYWRVLPVTSRKIIEDYVSRCSFVPGARMVSQAVKYITEGSGSPMETILTCLLCLPRRFGGYGLPLPKLNYRIERKGVQTSLNQRNYYLCDLYWPEAKLAVEYDSDQVHAASDRIAADAVKRNDLQTQGILPITVTWPQVIDLDEFEKVARQISRRLGVRQRKDRLASRDERAQLLHLLRYHR